MPLLPTDLITEKNQLRTHFLKLRQSRSPEQKEQVDRALRDAVTAFDEFQSCRCLLCYAPTRGEIDLMPLAKEALAMGKEVAFPISHPEDCTLTFHTVKSLDELVTGTYGIPEPPSHAPQFKNTPDTICLVPALSFDREGYRLGYGKGYYDRFLSSFEGGSAGVIYKEFILDRVSQSRYDRSIDAIVCEEGIIIPK